MDSDYQNMSPMGGLVPPYVPGPSLQGDRLWETRVKLREGKDVHELGEPVGSDCEKHNAKEAQAEESPMARPMATERGWT